MRPLNQTLLLQTAMIHLNPPRRERELFALDLDHPEKARRPVLRCAVCGANPQYFDFAKPLEPANCPVPAAQAGFGDGLEFALMHSNLPVRFEPCKKMPAQRAHQFQIVNRSLPAIKTNKSGIKSALACREQHLGEMVVFGFTIPVFIKHAIIHRHTPLAVAPQQGNQIDALDHRLLFARPVPIKQGVEGRSRVSQGSRSSRTRIPVFKSICVCASVHSTSGSGSRRAG